MRKLNNKQKQIVKEYFENDLLDITNAEYFENRDKLENELEKINDYETLWCDLDRFINDLQYSNNHIETIKNFQ